MSYHFLVWRESNSYPTICVCTQLKFHISPYHPVAKEVVTGLCITARFAISIGYIKTDITASSATYSKYINRTSVCQAGRSAILINKLDLCYLGSQNPSFTQERPWRRNAPLYLPANWGPEMGRNLPSESSWNRTEPGPPGLARVLYVLLEFLKY